VTQEEIEILDTEATTVGELLRNARLKKGLTISDVAAELCIRKVYINAIENMDLSNLPPMPYGLGFVRSYANYLGLNSDRIVSSYRQGTQAKEEEEDNAAEAQEATRPHFKHLLIALFGFAALFAAWQYLPQKVEENIEENTADMIAEPLIVDENGTPIDTDELQEIYSAPEEENSEIEELKAESLSTFESENGSDAEVVADIKPIEMVLSGPSWLELKQGEEVLLSGVYNKGFRYIIQPQQGLVISVGRHYNATFSQDGKEIKVISSLKKTNVSLDKFFKQN